MKEFKLFLLISLPLLLLPIIVHADETYYIEHGKVEITSDEYNKLLGLGFEEHEIYGMSERVFNENRNLTGEVINKKTLDVSEFPQLSLNPDETIGGGELVNPNNYGYCQTEYKKMTVYIISVNNGGFYRYKMTLEWRKMPSTRSWDIIALGHETNVEPGISATFEQEWCKSSGCNNTYEGTYYSYDNAEVVTFKLPTGSLTSMRSFLYYPVLRVNNNEVIEKITTIGDYAHAISTISTPLSRSDIDFWGEIRIPSHATKYDDILATDITQTVNWGA